MTLLYGGSAFRFYTLEVAKLLAQSTQLRYKIDALLANLKRQSEQTLAQITEMKPIAASREDARVFFDHYRGKVNKLEKAKQEDKTKEAEYQRNLKKLSEARTRFEQEQRRLDQIMEQVMAKIEFLIGDISLTFTQEVEARYYKEMHSIFCQLQDFEVKMREIALKAAQGEYGNVGNRAGLDLHIQF